MNQREQACKQSSVLALASITDGLEMQVVPNSSLPLFRMFQHSNRKQTRAQDSFMKQRGLF